MYDIDTKLQNLMNNVHYYAKRCIIDQKLGKFCRLIDIMIDIFPEIGFRYLVDGKMINGKNEFQYEDMPFTCGYGKFHLYLNTMELGQPTIIDREVKFEFHQTHRQVIVYGPFTPEFEFSNAVLTSFKELLRELLIFKSCNFATQMKPSENQKERILKMLERIIMEIS